MGLQEIKGSVAVLISGGVDSAVVVHLLCEMGLKPDLHYIKIGMEGEDSSCSAEEDIELSQATAKKYGLKLEVTDLQKEYWEQVVGYAIERVKAGLTPNPDVMCNRLIKFGAFEQRIGHQYDYIATGHYATNVEKDGLMWLGTAKDPVKDQTDFLAQLSYDQLRHTIFPIGHLMKEEDWQQVEQLLKTVYPGFTSQLRSLYQMSELEYHTCLLIKMRIAPKDIAAVLARDVSTISTVRSRLFQKVFGRKGGAKEWDDFILSICS